ncbi:MAG: CAP domain-containing protein [Gemmatales bacterium]|nr:CAP domain-containing protein [Gemmatales bacterium]MDW8388163.1 CAP domain-containing protein [Gemmatales bacterium]
MPPRRRHRPSSLQIEALEDRCLLTGTITFDAATGFLTITGTDQGDRAYVRIVDGQLRATLTNRADDTVLAEQDVNPAQVRRIVFEGGDGDDIFINDSAIRAVANGGPGNDYLEGGDANDKLTGGPGNDILIGFKGKDKLFGEAGEDQLFGMQGKDQLEGGADNDSLYGGRGIDTLTDALGTNLLDQFTDGELRTLYVPFGSTKLAAYFASDGSNNLSELEQRVFELINQERTSRGLAALTLNSRLISAAQHHATNMARFDRLAHSIPEADLPNLIDRINFYRYNYRAAGETIAFGYPGARDVVNAWMNSEGHRNIILTATYTQVGVGVRNNRQGRPYYCLVFGQPL